MPSHVFPPRCDSPGRTISHPVRITPWLGAEICSSGGAGKPQREFKRRRLGAAKVSGLCVTRIVFFHLFGLLFCAYKRNVRGGSDMSESDTWVSLCCCVVLLLPAVWSFHFLVCKADVWSKVFLLEKRPNSKSNKLTLWFGLLVSKALVLSSKSVLFIQVQHAFYGVSFGLFPSNSSVQLGSSLYDTHFVTFHLACYHEFAQFGLSHLLNILWCLFWPISMNWFN